MNQIKLLKLYLKINEGLFLVFEIYYLKGHYRISILNWPPDLAIFFLFFFS